jgi:mono/diheme cytochrome c family protein
MRLPFFIIVAIFLFSCNKKESDTIGTQNLPEQTFQINPTRDTILITKGGCKISILAGTFDGEGKVQLQLKEALTITDMILAGLSTRSGNMLLKSGGMVYINGERDNKQIKILKTIEISVPTSSYDADMNLFTGVQNPDTSINWIEPELILNREEKKLVINGQYLFQQTCQSCHSMEKVLTGPPLAYVTERRCIDWLKQATRNFADLAGKDFCAKEQIKAYGSIMPSFPQFSDSAIEAIYAYITAESAKVVLKEGGSDIYDPCRKIAMNDTTTKEKEATEKTMVGKTRLKKRDDTVNEVNDQSATDTIPTEAPQKQLLKEYYTFTIDAFGWYNIDVFIDSDPDFIKTTLFVNIKVEDKNSLRVHLIIPSKKIFVPGRLKKDNTYVFFYDDDGTIYLPKNQKVYIVGFTEFEETPLFGKLEFVTLSKNHFSLELSTSKNIVDEIKSLKLDDLKFEIEHHKMEKKILINERLYQFQCSITDSSK